eukprot:192709-Pyramimonas_sp.AAC.1
MGSPPCGDSPHCCARPVAGVDWLTGSVLAPCTDADGVSPSVAPALAKVGLLSGRSTPMRGLTKLKSHVGSHVGSTVRSHERSHERSYVRSRVGSHVRSH